MASPEGLIEGLSPDATIAALIAACNQGPDHLFITESWFAPFRARLLAALPAALTPVLVDALRDAIWKRRRLETVVEFVERQPTTWPEYEQWRTARGHEIDVEQARHGFFPWPDVDAARHHDGLQRAHPVPDGFRSGSAVDPHAAAGRACPGCGRPPTELVWIYFRSPDWTWQRLCGRAGWMVICDACHMQVDFFLKALN